MAAGGLKAGWSSVFTATTSRRVQLTSSLQSLVAQTTRQPKIPLYVPAHSRLVPASSFSTTSRGSPLLSTVSPRGVHIRTHKFSLLNTTSIQNNNPYQIRYCSHRRGSMCRTRAGFADGGVTSIQGRELLPTNVIPRHYNLTLEPDLEKFTFEGTVVIDLEVAEESKSVTLHTLDLQLHSAKVSANGQTISSNPTISNDKEKQTSTFAFDTPLEKGTTAQLEIAFTGELNDIMAGFSRSKYTRDDGTEGILASTQMEPTDCRRALPCFDEPALKAEFTLTLIAEKHLTCLGNMDVASETEKGTKKAVTFNKTPRMSTYLLAFVVGEFNYIETNDFRVPIRVYAPLGINIEHGRFSLNLAAKTLAFYEEIFGSEFPLPKMDQVAIPEFSAGAMENWGLITYRVMDLIIDEETSAAEHKLRVAEVVQHELAHQWFGNLVTMDWWEGLWLNEGFATWASWYSCNIFFPEWKVWESYLTDTLASALALDSLRSSHPIEVPIKKSEQVNEIFDAISYAKGSCVLRMLATYIGEDTFLEGVRHYLKKHAYKNTQTTDLWDSLGQVSGKPVAEVMNTWTKKIGFPVVTVTENGNELQITQNRFLRTGDVKPEDDTTIYPVFLNLLTKSGVDGVISLDQRERTIPKPDDDFFKLNANHTGLYRTSYSPERLEKLGQAARQGLLSVEDRAGMIADAGALAMSGYQKTSGVLNLLKGFGTESEYIVWSELITRTGSLRAAWRFEDENVIEGLDKFQRDLVAPRAHEIGWNFSSEDTQVQQRFKTLLFSAAGAAGDEKILAVAKDMFNKYLDGDKAALHPNIRGTVFALALKHGGEEEFEKLLKFYRSTTKTEEREHCLGAFGRPLHPELTKRAMGMMFSKDVPNHESHLLCGSLRAHAGGIEALLEFMMNNWDQMIKEMPPTLATLPRIMTYMTSACTTQAQLDKITEFFQDKDQTGFEQSLEQSKDSIRSKISWIDRDRDDVAAWVKDNGYLS